MPKDGKSENYRVRAVELRAIAETMKNRDTRKSLLDIADDYEGMAEQVDRMGLEPPKPKR